MKNTVQDVRFRWRRPKDGHEWSRGRRLNPRTHETEEVLDVTLVMAFRQFAQIDGGRDWDALVVGFADSYGDILALPEQEHPTAAMWFNAARELRKAVNLFDKIRAPETPGAARQRAQHLLQLKIHRALTDAAFPSHTPVELTPELKLAMCPVNLLAFMWLTLARLVSGEIEEHPCMGNCHGYIYTGIGPGLKKTGTTTCSDACRKWKERSSD